MGKQEKNREPESKMPTFAAGMAAGLVAGIILTRLFTGGGGGQAPPPPAPVAVNTQTVDYAERISRLETLLADDPGNYRAWVDLGNAYFDSNRPEESIEAYGEALKIDDTDPNVITDQGIMYRRVKRPDEAVVQFRKAIALNPNHPQSRYNLGLVLLHDKEDYGGALEAWEGFLKVLFQGDSLWVHLPGPLISGG